MFARAYIPSKIGEMTKLWEDSLKEKKLLFAPEPLEKQANMKDIIGQGIELEQKLKEKAKEEVPTHEYMQGLEEHFRDLLAPAVTQEPTPNEEQK